MSVKPPRIKVWLSQQLAVLAPKFRVLTEQPLYQKAQSFCQVQWQQPVSYTHLTLPTTSRV